MTALDGWQAERLRYNLECASRILPLSRLHPFVKLLRMAFSLGIDYGTNSMCAIVVDVADGRRLGSCAVDYPSGKHGIPCSIRAIIISPASTRLPRILPYEDC
jgi:molecular chaperone DnaK (HSP70)